jgi:glycosyltransferase involved in cell wall biosynthesis
MAVSGELSIAFVGSGTADAAARAAAALAPHAAVTLVAGSQPRVVTPGVDVVLVSEETLSASRESAFAQCHWESLGFFEALRRRFPSAAPDVLHFDDRGGAAFVTLEAALARDPWLDGSRVCVRLTGSAEMRAVLNGHLAGDFLAHVEASLERFCLRHADALLHAGPPVMRTYESFYPGLGFAPDVALVHPIALPRAAAAQPESDALRLLCLGPFERAAGVRELARAVMSLERDDVRLTVSGRDTDTAPLGESFRQALALEVVGDSRIELVEGGARALDTLVAEADLIVVPSRFEAVADPALLAMARNRPVLAPAAGAFPSVVEAGSGWLLSLEDEREIARAIASLADERESVRAAVERGGCRARAKQLVATPAETLATLHDVRPRRTRAAPPGKAGRAKPLVSVVVPYHAMPQWIAGCLESVFASTHAPLEVIVVNDGSFGADDEILLELETRYPITLVHRVNGGSSAARRLGFDLARGEYALSLDPDDLLEPTCIERCLDALEQEPAFAYASTWARHVDEDGNELADAFLFLGNDVDVVEERNVAGQATALIRRSVIDQGLAYAAEVVSHEDWAFYRALRERGLTGCVVPEYLLRYRVKRESMTTDFVRPFNDRLEGEIAAREREREVAWTHAAR